jgi:hypothetical protein
MPTACMTRHLHSHLPAGRHKELLIGGCPPAARNPPHRHSHLPVTQGNYSTATLVMHNFALMPW